MVKVNRAKILWLTVASVCAAACIVSIPLMIAFGKEGRFIHLAVCAVFAVQGFWGVPVYVYNFFKLRILARITAAVDNGKRELSDIAEAAGVNPEMIRPLVEKCIKKKYIGNFTVEDGTLKETE